MVLLNRFSILSKEDVFVCRPSTKPRTPSIGFFLWLLFFAVVAAVTAIILGMFPNGPFTSIGNIFDLDQELNVRAWAITAGLIWTAIGLPLWRHQGASVEQGRKLSDVEYVFTKTGLYASSHLVFPATEWDDRELTSDFQSARFLPGKLCYFGYEPGVEWCFFAWESVTKWEQLSVENTGDYCVVTTQDGLTCMIESPPIEQSKIIELVSRWSGLSQVTLTTLVFDASLKDKSGPWVRIMSEQSLIATDSRSQKSGDKWLLDHGVAHSLNGKIIA